MKKSQNIHFVQQHVSDNHAVYWITWKNMVQAGRPQMTI